MLGSAANASALAERLSARPLGKVPLVVDPVLFASSGLPLLDAPDARSALHALLARAALATPNWPELEALVGHAIPSEEGADPGGPGPAVARRAGEGRPPGRCAGRSPGSRPQRGPHRRSPPTGDCARNRLPARLGHRGLPGARIPARGVGAAGQADRRAVPRCGGPGARVGVHRLRRGPRAGAAMARAKAFRGTHRGRQLGRAPGLSWEPASHDPVPRPPLLARPPRRRLLERRRTAIRLPIHPRRLRSPAGRGGGRRDRVRVRHLAPPPPLADRDLGTGLGDGCALGGADGGLRGGAGARHRAPWGDVLAQYALWEGSLWPLLVLWVLVAPAAISSVQRSSPTAVRGVRG